MRYRTSRLGVVCVSAVLIAIALWAWAPGPARAEDCGTIQERVDAASDGATVDLPDGCVYREEVTIDKPLTLIGGPGVEVKGSDVWSAWQPSEAGGGLWRSDGALPAFTTYSKTGDPGNSQLCQEGVESCGLPEQVFFDGAPLEQVTSDPSSGQFAVDANRNVILADDPTVHEVEVTTRTGWLHGRSGADGVTVENISFSHAANAYHDAALANGPGNDDWLIKDNEISYASAADVSLTKATGLVMENNDVHHGGQIGLTVNDAAATLTNNRIHDNNSEHFNSSWAAGGVKGADTLSLEATGNDIYNNDGQGFWTDVASENVTFDANRVHHNTEKGVHFEITDGVEASANVIYENGWGNGAEPGGDLYGDAGILVVACRDVEIANNLLADNDDGITVINSQRDNGRGATEAKFDLSTNVRVHDNRIISPDSADGTGQHYGLAWVKTYDGGNLDDPGSGNEGYQNAFYPGSGGQGTMYKWVDSYDGASLGDFAGTPGGRDSRLVSEEEKGVFLQEAGLTQDPQGGLVDSGTQPATTPGAAPPEAIPREAPACPGARIVMSGSGSGQATTPAFSVQGPSLRLTVEPQTAPPDGRPVSATLVGEDGTRVKTLEFAGEQPESSLVSAAPGRYTVEMASGEVPYHLTVEDCQAAGGGSTGDTRTTATESTIPEPSTSEETVPEPTTLDAPPPSEETALEQTVPEYTAPEQTIPGPQAGSETQTTPGRPSPIASEPPTEGICPAGLVVMSGSGSGQATTPPFSIAGTLIGLTIEPGADPPDEQPISATLVGEDGTRVKTLEHDGADPASFLVPAEPGGYSVEMDSGEVPYRLTVEDCQAAQEGPAGDTGSTATESTTTEQTIPEHTVAVSEPTAPEETGPEQTVPEQTLPGFG